MSVIETTHSLTVCLLASTSGFILYLSAGNHAAIQGKALGNWPLFHAKLPGKAPALPKQLLGKVFHGKLPCWTEQLFWLRDIFGVPSFLQMRKVHLILSRQNISLKQNCCFSLFSFPCSRACTCLWVIEVVFFLFFFFFKYLATEETNLRVNCTLFNTHSICLLIFASH